MYIIVHTDLKKDTERLKLHKDIFQLLTNEDERFNELLSGIMSESKETELLGDDIAMLEDELQECVDYKVEELCENIPREVLNSLYSNDVDFVGFPNVKDNIVFNKVNEQMVENEMIYYGNITSLYRIPLHKDLIVDDIEFGEVCWKVESAFTMKKELVENQDYSPINGEEKYILAEGYSDIEVLSFEIKDYEGAIPDLLEARISSPDRPAG